MKKPVYIVFVLLLTLISCSGKHFFESKHTFEGNVWKRFDFVIFEVPVNKGDVLDFYISVKYSMVFGDELPLNITFYTPDGEMRSREYDFNLKGGKAVPHKNSGEPFFVKTFNVHKGMSFNKNGICKVRIEQKLPKFETVGIKSITLTAEKSKI